MGQNIKKLTRESIEFMERVRVRREQLGWTQTNLAEKIGCKRGYISNLERARLQVPLNTALSLAHVLGISIEPSERQNEIPDAIAKYGKEKE